MSADSESLWCLGPSETGVSDVLVCVYELVNNITLFNKRGEAAYLHHVLPSRGQAACEAVVAGIYFLNLHTSLTASHHNHIERKEKKRLRLSASLY